MMSKIATYMFFGAAVLMLISSATNFYVSERKWDAVQVHRDQTEALTAQRQHLEEAKVKLKQLYKDELDTRVMCQNGCDRLKKDYAFLHKKYWQCMDRS